MLRTCPSTIITSLLLLASKVGLLEFYFHFAAILSLKIISNRNRVRVDAAAFSAFSFPVPAREVLQNIEELIPFFRGVKFSGTDLMDFGQCVSRSPSHWSLLYGVDEVSFSSFFTLSDLL